MLSRSAFDSACQALVRKHASNPILQGWAWVEKYPYSYLSRSKSYRLKTDSAPEDPGLEEELGPEVDEAAAHVVSGTGDVISQQYVVFSPGFQVPAFYFTMHDTNGAPLSLEGLMNTTLFKFEIPAGSSVNGYALSLPDAPFPLLSQGDHPTLGTPCWYLHPCETKNAVDELFQEVEDGDDVRWMEMWFMTVSSALEL